MQLFDDFWSLLKPPDEFAETTQQTLSNISWQEINGMRNRLVHEYDDVNLNIVWDVVQFEIPQLIETLKVKIPPEP